MLRRLFWFLSGAATGVWATVKVGRAVRRLSPDSLAVTAADRALETGARLRLFAQDVRVGMVQRETELHDALGLRAQDAPQPLPTVTLAAPAPIQALPAQSAERADRPDRADRADGTGDGTGTGNPGTGTSKSTSKSDKRHKNRKDPH